MKILSLLVFLLFSFNAFAIPANHRLAHRAPNERWQDAYRRHVDRYETQTGKRPANKNAQEAAVKIDKLDTSVATEWGKSIDMTSLFFDVRDLRYLQTKDKPDFLRRISWLYPDDGCFARAAMMINRLRDLKIPDPSKVFIFGDLEVKTPNSPTGDVSWWYHVAPAVRINEQIYILDSAIDPYKPQMLMDWVKTMTSDPTRIKLAICKANAYTPSDACFEPKDNDAEDAHDDQVYYLGEEWERNVELGRNPVDVLGDNPPWKGN